MTRRVRAATEADLPRLLAIQATALDSGWPELLRSGVSGPPLVLVTGTGPAGYALAIADDSVSLVELAVAPAHQNMGHGSALLAAVCARGQRVTLTTRRDNDGARRFYERHGFHTAKRLPGHYDGDDGVLLVRQPERASVVDSPSGRS